MSYHYASATSLRHQLTPPCAFGVFAYATHLEVLITPAAYATLRAWSCYLRAGGYDMTLNMCTEVLDAAQLSFWRPRKLFPWVCPSKDGGLPPETSRLSDPKSRPAQHTSPRNVQPASHKHGRISKTPLDKSCSAVVQLVCCNCGSRLTNINSKTHIVGMGVLQIPTRKINFRCSDSSPPIAGSAGDMPGGLEKLENSCCRAGKPGENQCGSHM